VNYIFFFLGTTALGGPWPPQSELYNSPYCIFAVEVIMLAEKFLDFDLQVAQV
jgi:hypothetical protein